MNQKQITLTVVALFAVGAVLIAAAWFLHKKVGNTPSLDQRLAWVSRELGEVKIIRAWNDQAEIVDNRGFIVGWDSVETKDGSVARLEFESGDQITLKPNSLITIEDWRQKNLTQLKVVIKRGDVKVDSPGRMGELLIAKNGQSVGSHLYEESTLATQPAESSTTKDKKSNQAPEGLSESEISAVISASRSSFFKCYTQLMQKDPKATGEVTLSLSIENSGRVVEPRVSSKTLVDPQFQTCIHDVALRLSFRMFSGPTLSTLFPIQFQ